MKPSTTSSFAFRRIVLAILLTAAGLTSGAGIARAAQSSESSSGEGLVGTWMVQVTLRDCATAESLGSFSSLVTFNRGGTLSESTSSPAFAPGQRTSGHGTWERADHQAFTQHIVNLINFSTAANLPGSSGFNPALPITPGFFAGWATIIHTVTLLDRDHGTSTGRNWFYKTGGEPYRNGCSTAELVRFE